MARSLTVKHEEKAGTSPLLNAFLILALAWMIGGALIANAAPAVDVPAQGAAATR